MSAVTRSLTAYGLAADRPLLLYDGGCGVCHWCVHFVLRRDPGGALCFATLDSPIGQAVVAGLAEGTDSLVWVSVPPRRTCIESAAVLAVLRYLGGGWRLSGVLRIIPSGVRDLLYRAFARRRHRLGVTPASCPRPSEAEQVRFITVRQGAASG